MNGKRRLLGLFNHGSMACAMLQAIGAQLEYLILNGIQAMSAVSDRGRLLTIKTERGESNKILVAVQDCGIGIDPGDIERVFAAFIPPNPTAWTWDFPSVVRSLKITGAGFGPLRTMVLV
jgi:hypothetical protein